MTATAYTTASPFFGMSLKDICEKFLASNAKDRAVLAKHAHAQASRKAGKPQGHKWANTAEAMDAGNLDYVKARVTGDWEGVDARQPKAPAAKAPAKGKAAKAPAKAAAPAKPGPAKGSDTVSSLSKRVGALEEGMAYISGLTAENNTLLQQLLAK